MAAQIGAYIDAVRAEYSDHPTVVVLDTYGRAVKGAENDNDTTRDFYRHTGYVLKQRGVTWVRLDHKGYGDTDHSRGASAKNDDVDVVYELKAGDNAVELKCRDGRMPWVRKQSFWTKRDAGDGGPLRYERATHVWTPRIVELAAALECLGVSIDAGQHKAAQAYRGAGHKAKSNDIGEAQKYRRHVATGGVK